MLNKSLPASLLAAALATGAVAVSAHAGHAMKDGAHGQMSQFMAHHGFMSADARQGEPAKLGVAIAAVPQAELDTLSLEYGVRIQDVLEGSVAEKAGIRAGDLVTEIDGRPAYSPERLQHLVAAAEGASTIALRRNQESLRLQAEFASPERDTAANRAVLGIRIQAMTNELKEAFGTEGDAGVLVSQVLSGSAAKKAGLKAGDVIVSIGGDPISAVTDVHGVLGGYSPGETLDIAVVRDRQAKVMQIALGSSSDVVQPHVVHPHHGQQGHGMRGYGHYGHGYGHHGSDGKMPWHGGCHTGKGQRSS
jgi:S1-C subfamily serine protease